MLNADGAYARTHSGAQPGCPEPCLHVVPDQDSSETATIRQLVAEAEPDDLVNQRGASTAAEQDKKSGRIARSEGSESGVTGFRPAAV